MWQVFTGPALSNELTKDEQSTFRACLDQYADSNCKLSSSLWTPQSDNSVPVAVRHAVRIASPSHNDVVMLKYEQARNLVMAATNPLQNYRNDQLQTVFFSPEGDIMHQMMDCIFMGPYEQVPYWPRDSRHILTAPVWHRDGNGTSRAVDPTVCVARSADKSPPYSCGSSARQAVIKYFFRDYLQQNKESTMGAIVSSMVSDIQAAWNDSSKYMCPSCPNFLPSALNTQYQTVPTDTILRSLTSQLQTFYRVSLENPEVWTKHLDPKALQAYDWSQTPELVMREALYHAHKPVIRYDESEARSPMLTTALWHQCHGLLSNIFFTIPIAEGDLPRNLPKPPIDGVSALQAFVGAAVNEAFAHSPLFRHYNVSYVPSDSVVCRRNPRPLKSSKITVTPYNTLLDTTSWPILTAYGPDAFPFSGCFCGWRSDNNTNCFPPANACAYIPCPYALQDQASVISKLPKNIPSLPCPAMDASDQWGVMDATEADDWLLGVTRDYTISGYDLLKTGRGGLKAGNYRNMSSFSTPYATGRSVRPEEVVQPLCDADYRALPQHTTVKELRSFIKHLFPVAQGVYESASTAYCLRYTVESALLTAMQIANVSYAEQQLISDTWRVRCESQIAMLAMCKGLDVYRPPVIASNRVFNCPFSISSDPDVYMTPGCLVHKSGTFYDPCKCNACSPAAPLFSSFNAACKIPFDPRSLVQEGVPLGGWQVTPLDSFNREAMLSLKDAGNTVRGDDWATSEGFLNETGQHCDLMLDWWPEEETLPIGYHATTPCMANDTGYRTFDSAFAVERVLGASYTLVRLVYQHDATRDAAAVDSQHGSGGLCRGSNVGLPMFYTNTMQVCTRAVNSPLDVFVPSPVTPSPALGPEKCSQHSGDIPWFDPTGTRQDSSLNSVGTVPNMPATDASAYPTNTFSIGPAAGIFSDEGFGQGCAEFTASTCSAPSDCAAGFTCVSQTCVSSDFALGLRCLRHSMCPDDMMCDGMGRCARGEVVYLNELSGPVEASVFAEQCDEASSTPYFTDGASPWEYVPDWLQGHGMCSNKNWYAYNQNLQGVQTCASCQQASCSFNSRTCNAWWPQLSTEPKRFAVRPTLCDRDYEHLVGPRGGKMTGCTPNNAQISDANGGTSPVAFSSLFRNYDSRGVTQMANMPFLGYNKTGFLGQAQDVLTTGSIVNCENFQNCYAYPFTVNNAPVQRAVPAGLTNKTRYDDSDIFRCGVFAVYSAALSKCILDQSVLPLYTALCKQQRSVCTCDIPQSDYIGCSPTVNKARLLSVCGNIQEQYTASYTTIQANAKGLQDLFTIFNQADGSLQAHLSGVECFQSIHQSMQNKAYSTPIYGLYYPFAFALLDVPLAWLYHCTFQGGIVIDPGASTIRCHQFEDSKNVSDPALNTNPSNTYAYLDFSLVRGGYLRQHILANIQAVSDRIEAALPHVSDIPTFKSACNSLGVEQCDMVPYCAKQRDWVPWKQLDSLDRKMLAALYESATCSDTKRDVILGMKQTTFADYIQSKTVFSTFTIDSTMSPLLPSIRDLISSALQACIVHDYNAMHKWPFLISFPDDTKQSISDCMLGNLQPIFNNLSMKLIRAGSQYTDVRQAYMPSSNINEMRPGSNKNPDNPVACIFSSLNEQRAFYDMPALPNDCVWTNMKCVGDVTCKNYSKTYMYGLQNCSYPTKNPYISHNALVYDTWSEMSDYFINAWKQNQSPLTSAQPVSLSFYSDTYFSQWKYDASGIKNYLSNINPDTSKEVMCVISQIALNFTQCNDANFDALQRFTNSLRQRAAPIVPGIFSISLPHAIHFLFEEGGHLGSGAHARFFFTHIFFFCSIQAAILEGVKSIPIKWGSIRVCE